MLRLLRPPLTASLTQIGSLGDACLSLRTQPACQAAQGTLGILRELEHHRRQSQSRIGRRQGRHYAVADDEEVVGAKYLHFRVDDAQSLVFGHARRASGVIAALRIRSGDDARAAHGGKDIFHGGHVLGCGGRVVEWHWRVDTRTGQLVAVLPSQGYDAITKLRYGGQIAVKLERRRRCARGHDPGNIDAVGHRRRDILVGRLVVHGQEQFSLLLILRRIELAGAQAGEAKLLLEALAIGHRSGSVKKLRGTQEPSDQVGIIADPVGPESGC
jgi:hypothetical protein